MQTYGQTIIHPAALVAVVILALVILTCPRRWAVTPFLVACCFISPAQRLVIAGVDFDVPRILILVGVIRVALRGDFAGFRWRMVDTLVLGFTVSNVVAYAAYYGTTAALINRMGYGLDVAGTYFVFRALVREWADVDRFVRSLALLSLPVLVFFLIEHSTGRNLFSALGGVPEITEVRNDRLRCQGAFAHSIIAGLFWATTVPLLVAWPLAGAKFRRYLEMAGAAIAVGLVILSASSTPVMAVMFCVVGFAFFGLRRSMRTVRWSLFGALLLLHLVMKAPVWSLIGRIDIVSGSTGWHRYLLLDAFFANFGEWALMGTNDTAHWGPGLADITNQFVLVGVRGGLASLLFFIAIIALTFRSVGIIVRREASNPLRRMTAWALGVTLFIHVTAFLAVSYFGQVNVLWYLLLATIVSIEAGGQPLARRRVPADVRGAVRVVARTVPHATNPAVRP